MLLNKLSQKRLLPIKYTINWEHPVSRELLACYLPGISAGLNITGMGGDMAPFSTPTQPWNCTVEGPSSNCANSATDGWITTFPQAHVNRIANNGTASIYWRGYFQTASDSGGIGLLFINWDSLGEAPYSFLGTGAYTGFLTSSWNTGGSFVEMDSPSASVSNSFIGFLSTYKVGGNGISYINGKVSNTQAFGASGPTVNTAPYSSPIVMNGCGGSDLKVLLTSMNMGCIWSRELSASEAVYLEADPYCFLTPASDSLSLTYSTSRPGGIMIGL